MSSFTGLYMNVAVNAVDNKNAHFDKCNVLDMSFNLMRVEIFLSVCSGFGKNVIIFSADMSSLLHIDEKKMSWFLEKTQQMVYIILRSLQKNNIL